MDARGVGTGGRLENLEGTDDLAPRAKRVYLCLLGGLRDKIEPGTPLFDFRKFREEGYDPCAYWD